MADSEREIVEERATSKEWRRLGHYEHKNASSNKDGVPDRFYARPGIQFFCEWKRVGEPLNDKQEIRVGELRAAGVLVLAPCYSQSQFWRFVRAHQTYA